MSCLFFFPDLKQSPPYLIAAFLHCMSNLVCLLSNYCLYKLKALQAHKWTQSGNVSKPFQPENLKNQKIKPNYLSPANTKACSAQPQSDSTALLDRNTREMKTPLSLQCTMPYSLVNCWQCCHNYAQTFCKYARKQITMVIYACNKQLWKANKMCSCLCMCFFWKLFQCSMENNSL